MLLIYEHHIYSYYILANRSLYYCVFNTFLGRLHIIENCIVFEYLFMSGLTLNYILYLFFDGRRLILYCMNIFVFISLKLSIKSTKLFDAILDYVKRICNTF